MIIRNYAQPTTTYSQKKVKKDEDQQELKENLLKPNGNCNCGCNCGKDKDTDLNIPLGKPTTISIKDLLDKLKGQRENLVRTEENALEYNAQKIKAENLCNCDCDKEQDFVNDKTRPDTDNDNSDNKIKPNIFPMLKPNGNSEIEKPTTTPVDNEEIDNQPNHNIDTENTGTDGKWIPIPNPFPNEKSRPRMIIYNNNTNDKETQKDKNQYVIPNNLRPKIDRNNKNLFLK